MSRESLKIIELFDADQLALDHIESTDTDDSFFISNVGDVVQKFLLWKELMPRVDIAYAMKANSHVSVAGTLAALGTGFDCASRGEIDKALKLGVSPNKIVFAQTAKQISHIKFAKEVGVELITFDNEDEVRKVATFFPKSRLILRLRCDSNTSKIAAFGDKFGCLPGWKSEFLLKMASELHLNVCGVSFYVGRAISNHEIYDEAITAAADAIKFGKTLGHQMNLLDIGGGYLANDKEAFTNIAAIINKSISKNFPDQSVNVIAEPGSFFCQNAMTLYANIHSKSIKYDENGEEVVHYHITDGVYQSFVYLLLYTYKTLPFTMRPMKNHDNSTIKKSVIWGRTCDPIDVICRNVYLPEMDCGEWISFNSFGAYRLAVASNFNGFCNHEVLNFIERKDWATLKTLKVADIEMPFA